jgi:hypothetical protein
VKRVLIAAAALLAVFTFSAGAAPSKYTRSWVVAAPQHYPGDTDNHVVLTASAPGGGFYLVTAVVNYQNLSGTVQTSYNTLLAELRTAGILHV